MSKEVVAIPDTLQIRATGVCNENCPFLPLLKRRYALCPSKKGKNKRRFIADTGRNALWRFMPGATLPMNGINPRGPWSVRMSTWDPCWCLQKKTATVPKQEEIKASFHVLREQ